MYVVIHTSVCLIPWINNTISFMKMMRIRDIRLGSGSVPQTYRQCCGSGSWFLPLTNGSGSMKPKNIRILRITIPNTVNNKRVVRIHISVKKIHAKISYFHHFPVLKLDPDPWVSWTPGSGATKLSSCWIRIYNLITDPDRQHWKPMLRIHDILGWIRIRGKHASD